MDNLLTTLGSPPKTLSIPPEILIKGPHFNKNADNQSEGCAIPINQEENIELTFRNCLDRITEGIAILDEKGLIRYANYRFATFVGEPVENIISTPFSTLIVPEDNAITARIIENRSSGTIHLRTKTKPVQVTLSAETTGLPETETVCLVITPEQHEGKTGNDSDHAISRTIAIEKTNKEITALFTGIYEFDNSVDTALEKLGTVTGASRSYIFILSEDQVYLYNTHEWCAEGITPQKENLQHQPADVFPWWMKTLRNREIIHINDVSRLPAEASAEQQILTEQDIKSVLVLPLFAGEELKGFIGLDNVLKTGTWNEDDIYLLASSAAILGKALELRQREDEVARLSSFREKIIDDPDIWVAGSTINGNVIIWNKGAENITGYTQNEVLGSKAVWSKITPDSEKRQSIANISKNLSEGGFGPTEIPFPLITKNGDERYLTLSLRTLTDRTGKPYAIFGIGIDNTEQRLAEKEVQRTHRQLTNIIDFLPDGTGVIDKDGIVIAWNQAMEKITGVPKEEILEKGNHAYSVPFYGDRRPTLVDYVLQEKNINPEEYPNIIQSGNQLTGEIYLAAVNNGKGGCFLATAAPLYDDEGNLAGGIESLRDISGLKATEEALRQNEELFRTITTAALDGIIMVDENGRVILWNKAAETILGYSAAEVTGKNLHELVAPEEYRETYTQGFNHFIKTGTGQVIGKTIELSAKHKDGTTIPVELSLSAIQMHDEWHAVGILRDITERKESEKALQQSELRLNFAVDSAHLGGWDWNLTTGSLTFDQRWENILGYAPESFPTTVDGFFDLIHPEDLGRLKTTLAKYFASKKTYYSAAIRAKSREGTWRWIRTYGTVMGWDPDGNPLRMIGLHQDIDRIVRSEEALKEANKKLSLLSSITRHDILNQIGILLVYGDLLKGNLSVTDLEDAEFLEAILEATRTIERQITFTRDYEDLGLSAPVWQDVAEATEKVISEIHPEGITIVNQCLPGLEILADPMFGKVIFNLLENAIRHGETITRIAVSADTTSEDCTIIVQDDGVGVPTEMKHRIFERGVGSHTGFGLFLSQEILAITNITITENGIPEKGARFEMHIPPEGFRVKKPDQ